MIINIEESLKLIKTALTAAMLFFMVTAFGKHAVQTSAWLFLEHTS